VQTVLVVDDDRNITKLLDFAFQRAGYTVLLARDGDEGLALAAAHAPDAAVLDVMMPGMHGYELCRRLRADPRTQDIKIVFLTARSQPIDEQEGKRAGGDLFLAKPVLPEELVSAVESLLAGTGAAAEAGQKPGPRSPEKRRRAPRAKARTAPLRPDGRLIVCLGGARDVGVTTIAANLSIAFSVARRAQTPLVELHSKPGDLLPALGLTLGPPYGDLKATGVLLTWDTLPLHLMDHATGVRVLPAPPEGSDVEPALTERAVRILRGRFPLIVADCAAKLDDRGRPVILSSDLALMVTTPHPAVLRASWEAIQELCSLDYPARQILLVVNHTLPEPGVPMEEIRKGFRIPILAEVPFESNMPTLVEIGKPVLLAQPECPMSIAIARMAELLGRGLR